MKEERINMVFQEPKVEFVQFDGEVSASAGSNRCSDNMTGGVFTCEGSNTEIYCGEGMQRNL